MPNPSVKIIVRNSLVLLGGLVAGSIVNMGLILIGGQVIPPPPGADLTTMEGLRASMSLFELQHFVFPFLAHALGTLAGAYFTAQFAASRHFQLAMVIGVFFLAGGITNVIYLPSPLWFNTLDLIGTYIPMAWAGARLAGKRKLINPSIDL